MALRDYLQLVRLPNVFTAAADSLAGWLLVGGALAEPRHWLPLAGASMALYAAGVVLNDVFDLEVDRQERPGRPLPSGRVPYRTAVALGVALLLMGLALAGASGSTRSLAVAASLAACVLAYDAGLKRTWLGPPLMGVCRGLNVLLGMSQVPALGGPAGWLTAGSLAVFVVGITCISRSETRSGERSGPALGWAIQNLGLLGLMAATLQVFPFPGYAPGVRPIVPLEGLLVLLLAALAINRATGRAVVEPIPARLQKAVKVGVLSLVWLDFGVVAAVRGPVLGLAVIALWGPAFLLARRLYTT